MTEDEIMELGGYSASIMSSPQFATIISQYETSLANGFLSSKPADQAERERIYARYSALHEFLGFMADIVKRSAEIQEEFAPQQDDIDDPSVHDIYRSDDPQDIETTS
jgi:hypothetical protein